MCIFSRNLACAQLTIGIPTSVLRLTYMHVQACTTFTCMYIHEHACTYMYMHVHACTCICMYIHSHACTCFCMYMHVYACTCICMYVHVQACSCICMQTSTVARKFPKGDQIGPTSCMHAAGAPPKLTAYAMLAFVTPSSDASSGNSLADPISSPM